MAAVPWKPLFAERYEEAFALAGVARGRLADVVHILGSPLRGGAEDPVLVADCAENLGEASRLLALMLSSLGTVELLAVRYLRTDDAAEVRARARARAARERASNAYHTVASARGHLGSAGHLCAAAGVLYRAAEDERVVVLAAIQRATQLLDGMEVLRTSDTALDVPLPRLASGTLSAAAAPAPVGVQSDVALPRLHSSTGSASAAPTRVGVQSDAAWTLLGGAVPGFLLHVALSGALPELEAAQAALLVCAAAVDKLSLSTVYPAAEYSASYSAAFRALDAAHAALSGLLALKIQAGVLLLRCAPQLGLDRGGQRWLAWEAASADAERHGRAALDHLWSASALTDCTFAGLLAWAPPSSAGQEARQLLQRAAADAGEAQKAGDHLRHAAARAFYHAWSLLNRGPA